MQSLLPHRVTMEVADVTGQPMITKSTMDAELQQLAVKYETAQDALYKTMSTFDHEDVSVKTFDLLKQAAVWGPSSSAQVLPHELRLRKTVCTKLEHFMLELERWSIELQRHCPTDWNQWCALLVRCLMEQPVW